MNKKRTTKPITITLPSGSTIQSTHTCNLDIPWILYHVTETHIISGLAYASLISKKEVVRSWLSISIRWRQMLRILQRQTCIQRWTMPDNKPLATSYRSNTMCTTWQHRTFPPCHTCQHNTTHSSVLFVHTVIKTAAAEVYATNIRDQGKTGYLDRKSVV